MSRHFEGGSIVVASHNKGKVREIAGILSGYGIDIISAAELGLSEPEETGASFIENAEIKAKSAAGEAKMVSLADDSGLEVAALGGAPGIYSARWAGPNKDFDAAMNRLEAELSGKSDRRANFTCAMSICWPDGYCRTFEGHVHGRIIWPQRGLKGFGYDPIFVAEGDEITFAEMDPERKHAISHRAEAMRKLVNACFGKREA